MSWERLCLTNEQGDLGFRDIQCFNQALLAKQAWRVIQHPNSLFSQVLKSIYFENDNFLEAGFGYRPFYAWRSIMYGRDLLKLGLKNDGEW